MSYVFGISLKGILGPYYSTSLQYAEYCGMLSRCAPVLDARHMYAYTVCSMYVCTSLSFYFRYVVLGMSYVQVILGRLPARLHDFGTA